MGRLRPDVLGRTATFIREDAPGLAVVFRRDERVATFRTRVAPATSSTVGRDQRSVRGESAPHYYTLDAPLLTDVQNGDEVWAGAHRYRVVAVDAQPHTLQLLVQHIQ